MTFVSIFSWLLRLINGQIPLLCSSCTRASQLKEKMIQCWVWSVTYLLRATCLETPLRNSWRLLFGLKMSLRENVWGTRLMRLWLIEEEAVCSLNGHKGWVAAEVMAAHSAARGLAGHGQSASNNQVSLRRQNSGQESFRAAALPPVTSATQPRQTNSSLNSFC